MASIKKVIVLMLAVVVALLLQGAFTADLASAHRMLIDEEKSGVLKVYYQGNIAAVRATVTLLDSQGNTLAEGSVDTEGKFYYDPKLKPALAEADDGLGHGTTYDFSQGRPDEAPVVIKALFVVSLFLFVSAYFYRQGQRKKAAP
jgi:hypothetical protein